MKRMLLIYFFVPVMNAAAQQNRIKAGVLVVPLFQSGFGMGNIGFERLNKQFNSSWQIHFCVAGGSIASDAETNNRKWVTVEKTYYLKSKKEKAHFFYSFFAETGNRITLPGHSYFKPDSIINKTKSFEINPGVSLGWQLKIKKRWGIEMLAGPKIIFASKEKQYYNSLNNQHYTVSGNHIKAGFRFMTSLYYQF